MNTTTEATRAEFHNNRKIAQAAVDAVFESYRLAAGPVVKAETKVVEFNRNTSKIALVRVGKGTKKHTSDGVSASCGADRHGWNYSELRTVGTTTAGRVSADVTCARCRAMFNA